MIVKCSSLPTGKTLTATFYDTATNPEAVVAAAGGALTEEGTTGVYKRDVGSALDAYTKVRMRISNGADGWIKPASGTVEVASDPGLLNVDASLMTMASRFLGMIELDGSVYRYSANSLEQGPAGGGGGGGGASNFGFYG